MDIAKTIENFRKEISMSRKKPSNDKLLTSGGQGLYSLTFPISASYYEVWLCNSHNDIPLVIYRSNGDRLFIKLNVPQFASFWAEKAEDSMGRKILIITSVASPSYKTQANINGKDYFF